MEPEIQNIPEQPEGWRSWLGLGGFVTLVATVSAVGGVATAGSVHTWYQTLSRPSFTPPDWVFAPAWTTLYVMIAISGWLVWKKVGFRSAKSAFMVYGVQLALNLAWSILFFGLHQIGFAMVDVLLLLTAIVVNVRTFRPINRTAALLLLPYAVWVAFASLLNLGFLLLNS